MAAHSTHLKAKRQKLLAALGKAIKAHRGGVRLARSHAVSATHNLLRAELAEREKSKMAVVRSAKRPDLPDLFQGAH